MGTLMLFGLFVGGAQAGQNADAWTQVHAFWPFDHGYYKTSPNGVVHEKWSCDSNWENCDGNALYHPVSKFADPPDDNVCDLLFELNIHLFFLRLFIKCCHLALRFYLCCFQVVDQTIKAYKAINMKVIINCVKIAGHLSQKFIKQLFTIIKRLIN